MTTAMESVAIRPPAAAYTVNISSSHSELLLGDATTVRKAAGKTVVDMLDLLYGRDDRIYDFYVGLEEKSDQGVFAAAGLRYDLIVVYPGAIAGEFKKTSGHEHIGPYPEIYEVLSGTALFLLQKGTGTAIDHFAAIEAAPGQKILVPPGYGHATVNIGQTPLVFADLVFDKCQNRYAAIKDCHGMAYYAIEEHGNLVYKKNGNYDSHPEIVFPAPYEHPELGLTFAKPVYGALIENPGVFRYLSEPDAYMREINRLADIIQNGVRK